jgi:hypothetical protein
MDPIITCKIDFVMLFPQKKLLLFYARLFHFIYKIKKKLGEIIIVIVKGVVIVIQNNTYNLHIS